VRWLEEVAHEATLRGDKGRDQVAAIIRARQAEGDRNATVNHAIQVTRAILRKAERAWGWLEKAPTLRCGSAIQPVRIPRAIAAATAWRRPRTPSLL
jgi:hypothetical protein